jgi:uncharacterized NAD(P)/FAD-binding protein YdhS
MSNSNTVVIIGAGFSGSLVAVHLLRQAIAPLKILLLDRRAAIGQGVAYSTPFDCHLLNVPAGKMSALAGEPDHFLQWLQTNAALLGAWESHDFVPRKFYGYYVQALLQEAIAQAAPGVCCKVMREEAIAIKPDGDTLTVCLSSGERIAAHQVVLALGNFPPGNPPIANPEFYQSQRYIGIPWSFDAIERISTEQSVLLIGSGLTAIDLAIALHQRGHKGKIQIVSRRGLLPQSHLSGASPAAVPSKVPGKAPELKNSFVPAQEYPATVRDCMHRLRLEVKSALAQGQDWREVFDALRPDTQRIWQSFSLKEKRRFLRHVRVYWDVHRHRIAPQVAETIAFLLQTQQLSVDAGRIQSFHEDERGVDIVLRQRGSQQTKVLRAEQVINCTGSECDYRKFQHPLITDLLQSGLLCPDPLSLGLEVTAAGRLAHKTDRAYPIYTLGSSQKGCFWETTAVREIRQQAEQLAEQLMEDRTEMKE